MSRRLYRLPEQGQLTGVAAGLGDYFNIDPTVVRVLIVALAFLTDGLAVLAYFLLALILPTRDGKGATSSQRFRSFAQGTGGQQSASNARNWLGVGLIVIGGWFLISQLWPGLIDIQFDILWPLALIAIGGFILLKRR